MQKGVSLPGCYWRSPKTPPDPLQTRNIQAYFRGMTLQQARIECKSAKLSNSYQIYAVYMYIYVQRAEDRSLAKSIVHHSLNTYLCHHHRHR